MQRTWAPNCEPHHPKGGTLSIEDPQVLSCLWCKHDSQWATEVWWARLGWTHSWSTQCHLRMRWNNYVEPLGRECSSVCKSLASLKIATVAWTSALMISNLFTVTFALVGPSSIHAPSLTEETLPNLSRSQSIKQRSVLVTKDTFSGTKNDHGCVDNSAELMDVLYITLHFRIEFSEQQRVPLCSIGMFFICYKVHAWSWLQFTTSRTRTSLQKL